MNCLPAISIFVSRNTPLESSALWLSACFLEDAEAAEALLEPLDEAVEELLDRGGGGGAAAAAAAVVVPVEVMDLEVGKISWPAETAANAAASKLESQYLACSMEGLSGSRVE